MITDVIKPNEIEKRSFEIISSELEQMEIVINGSESVHMTDTYRPVLDVIKRCIHTTADFDYAKTMYFSKDAIDRFRDLIRGGASIVTDTNMALSGINKKILEKYGCRISCFMADDDVRSEAQLRGVTRACVSMERAMTIGKDVIFVVGNAPTALLTLRQHYDKGDYIPAFIVGVPVGFVNVVASKEMIVDTDIPYIINKGRKGGSNVAAAIVNAILYSMDR